MFQKVLQVTKTSCHCDTFCKASGDTMVNTTPWQGIIQINLRHKSLSWLLSYLVCLLGEGMVFSKGPRQEKLEVQDTEISTSRRFSVVMKQGMLKPTIILTSSVPGSEPCQAAHLSFLGVWHSSVLCLKPCCTALHEPLLQLHLFHLRLSGSYPSCPSILLAFTALMQVRWQRQWTSGCDKGFVNRRVPGLSPLSHYL